MNDFKINSERELLVSDEMQWVIYNWINIKCDNCGFIPLDVTNAYFKEKVNKFVKRCRKCFKVGIEEKDTI